MNPLPHFVAALLTADPIGGRDSSSADIPHTVKMASELARDGSTRSGVRALAYSITDGARRLHLTAGHLAARWIRTNLAYRMETPGVEVLSGPVATLLSGGGDCDDLAIVWASLVQAVGIPAWPVAWAPSRGARFEHMVGYCAGSGRLYELSDARAYGAGSPPLLVRGGVALAWPPDAKQPHYLVPL